MFVLSKLLWLIFSPSNLFLFVVCGGALLVLTKYRRAGRRLLGAAAVAGLVVATVPLGGWLITPLENRFAAPAILPDTVTGVIVLGGAVDPEISAARGRMALKASAERIVAFADLARRFPAARLVYTGGSGNPFDQRYKEADAAKDILRRLGVAPGRVLFENRSRNTHENALFVRDHVKPADGERWILITSAFHMPRAVGTFRKSGWSVIPYPVDFRTPPSVQAFRRFSFAGGMAALDLAAKEWVGLIAYYVLGRTDSLLPAPGRNIVKKR